jgi:hypothetical protein
LPRAFQVLAMTKDRRFRMAEGLFWAYNTKYN